MNVTINVYRIQSIYTYLICTMGSDRHYKTTETLNEPPIRKRTRYNTAVGSTKCKLTRLAITLINGRLVNGFEMTTGFVRTVCLHL